MFAFSAENFTIAISSVLVFVTKSSTLFLKLFYIPASMEYISALSDYEF